MSLSRIFSHRSNTLRRTLGSGVVLALLSIGLIGCSERRVTDFTIISTKNTLLLANADRSAARITGEDCHFLLFGMPDMKNAIDDAIEKAGPEYDALVDGVVTWEDDFFQVCYKVEGTPIKAKKPSEVWKNVPTMADPTTAPTTTATPTSGAS